MDTIKEYDLIAIGSGPAGQRGAEMAAYFGHTVAVIEKESVLGGAAANTGTLPSKTLRETALYLSGFTNRDLYGLRLELKGDVTAKDFLYREKRVTSGERNRISELMKTRGIDVHFGLGRFIDPHTVEITPREGEKYALRARYILIASGSRPNRPALYPFADPRVYDSDEITELNTLPKRLAVVGGGVIGCEYACMFAALGLSVALIDGKDRLLSFLDREVAASLEKRMRAMGVELVLNEHVEKVEAKEKVELTLTSGRQVDTDMVLVAAGRTGNTENLMLEKAGLAVDPKHHLLPVDSVYRTTVPHIYAAGDVIGFPALASTSMEQGRVAVAHAFDLKYKPAVANILPYGIYTIPEVSMAGETEESLREKKIPYVVGHGVYAHNARGEIIGEKEGFLKLLFGADDLKLLGVHIIGEEATDLVHIGLTALITGATVELFVNTCYNYPTLSELYKLAAYNGLRRRNEGEVWRPDKA